MNRFKCDKSYENYLKQYNDRILKIYGVSSKTSEREIICMSEEGNTVALTLYADMVYYKKLLRHNPERDAFKLYMKAASMEIDDEGKWKSGDDAYPLAFWNVGFYLLNYRRESVLKKCEKIDVIENMSIEDRLITAFELAITCLDYVQVPGAVNLMGRIMNEISEDGELFSKTSTSLQCIIKEHDLSYVSEEELNFETPEDLKSLSDCFFEKAATEGYVYACNSLALREADKIYKLMQDENGASEEEIDKAVNKYIKYLKISADRYEPYAANRLGLFYRTGEILGGFGKVSYKKYISNAVAKEYFEKATVYPDENSAWAYLNLLKYYHQDYDKDIDLMNEHMEYIKELNPDVYSIAMEL